MGQELKKISNWKSIIELLNKKLEETTKPNTKQDDIDLVSELKESVTIIMVTHNIRQASRISDFTAFLSKGELVEYGSTEKLFTVPEDKRTEEYLSRSAG